jgi:hypothetical protein
VVGLDAGMAGGLHRQLFLHVGLHQVGGEAMEPVVGMKVLDAGATAGRRVCPF